MPKSYIIDKQLVCVIEDKILEEQLDIMNPRSSSCGIF